MTITTLEQAQDYLNEFDPGWVEEVEYRYAQEHGPLTRRTTPEEWDAYWIGVAKAVQALVAAPF